MWELYALWSWLAAFFAAARQVHPPGLAETGTASLTTGGNSHYKSNLLSRE